MVPKYGYTIEKGEKVFQFDNTDELSWKMREKFGSALSRRDESVLGQRESICIQINRLSKKNNRPILIRGTDKLKYIRALW